LYNWVTSIRRKRTSRPYNCLCNVCISIILS